MIEVLDASGMELGKYSYSQLQEFGLNSHSKEVEMLDVPRKIVESDANTFLVILMQKEDFIDQVVEKILDLEEDVRIKKVILDKSGESREIFKKRSEQRAREAAEQLVEELR